MAKGMVLSICGLLFSLAPFAIWPFLALAGVMSIAGEGSRGLSCFSSWWGAFLCTSTFYPLLYVTFGGIATWLLIRKEANGASVLAAWAPLLILLVLAQLSGVLGTITGLAEA
jgi:hypothetical protein